MSTWRNKWITSHAGTIDDFINTFEALAKQFRQWKEWGIKLHDDGGIGDDYATFITDDMDVAIKAGFTVYIGDHNYKKIPICDKWKRDTNAKTYPVKIDDFIDKVYKDHYEQVKSYAYDVKLAVMVVIDSREEIRTKNPDLVKDCYRFEVNEQDGIITAIFIKQVSDITPSKRK